MRVHKKDGSQARRILIGMIVNSTVLGRIAAKWDKELFDNKWCNLVGGWCVSYFRKYGKAPRRAIEGLYEKWASTAKDSATMSLVESFISSLSGEYKNYAKEINAEYLIDAAAEYFNQVRLRRLADSITDELDGGDITKALAVVPKFGRIEMGVGAGISPLINKEAIRSAFTEKRDPLVEYPGALGNFLSPYLERDGFIVFMGPEKRGKTFCLLDLAWRGMMQNRKVAFFEVGDMSQNQIMRRFMVRAAKRPLKPCKIRVPTHLESADDGAFAKVDHEEREFKKGLNWKVAWKACEKVVANKQGENLRLACYPNSSLSVDGMRGVLQEWERFDWVPDIVVIDYVDILARPHGFEGRDAIDETWKQLRSLSQSLHCLVVTATQSNAASYDSELLTMNNFSEDKRKFAHCTGMVGLNQSKQEKKNGQMRWNWIVLREADFAPDYCVHIAGCLSLANPTMKSTF